MSKILVDRAKFLKILKACKEVSGKRSPMPILSGVLVEMRSGKLFVGSTDINLSIYADITVDSDAGFAAAINCKKLLEIVSKVQCEKIALEQSGNEVILTGGRSRYRLPYMSAVEYPHIPIADVDTDVIDAAELRTAVGGVAYATSDDISRLVLGAVHLSMVDGRNRLAAVDGHRAATYTCDLGFELECLVPGESIRTALRVIDDTEIGVSMRGDDLVIIGDDLTVVAKTIDAQFPPIDQMVIDRDKYKSTVVSSADLLDTIARASIVSPTGRHISIYPVDDGSLGIRSSSDDGQFDEIVECSSVDLPCEIAVNAKYLMDWLSRATGDVTVGVYGDTCPLVLDCGGYSGIVMPIRPIRSGY